MEIKEYFSVRIRELRKKHNLTQQELGEIVGVIKQTVNAWEILQRVPQADVLCKLANSLYRQNESYAH